MSARARPRRKSTLRLLERTLLFVWLVFAFPGIAADVQRLPEGVSFASEVAWAPVDLTLGPAAVPTLYADVVAAAIRLNTPPAPASPGTPAAQGPQQALPSGLTPAAGPGAEATPTPEPTPVSRYLRGGIDWHHGPISMAYPATLTDDTMYRVDDLVVLMADASGENYRRFVTEFDRQLYAYPELASGTFVLSVHDGTLSASNRDLEAEALRRLIEGPLHNAVDLQTIETRLAALIGRHFEITQAATVARFTITQARRMSANDVADYLYRPMEISLFMEPIASPETSFLLLFCSGRQPDEPRRSFPGRFLLVLEHDPGASVTRATEGATP